VLSFVGTARKRLLLSTRIEATHMAKLVKHGVQRAFNMKEFFKNLLFMIAASTLFIAAGLALFSVYHHGKQEGIEIGRSQFHNELIIELDARGGAPVLLYPPKELIND